MLGSPAEILVSASDSLAKDRSLLNKLNGARNVKPHKIWQASRIYGLLALGALLLGLGLLILAGNKNQGLISPLGLKIKTLEKYSFANLRQREYLGSEIKLEKIIKEETDYTSWLFSFYSEGKKVTGMANLPAMRSPKGIVVMIRGYADDEIYFTGLGTRKAAGVFASNGFVTLAPDFLGFGGSDAASNDIMEARFERPITVLNLLASIEKSPSTTLRANPNKIGIWAHSNGGQIALSVLEISQKPIPTTLWAPVTLGFPQSVLAYMDQMSDQGKKVKEAIDEFAKVYNPQDYSIDHYFVDITAPLQLHQGTADQLVKAEWSDEFVKTMKSSGKEMTYYKYFRNDHNLSRSWNLVVSRDLEFFRKNLVIK